MRLPWIQVAMEVLEVSAPELAARLDISDAEAFYALVRMMAWARARCPEDKAPSESATVVGPSAVRQIAAGAQFKGDAAAFVEVCCTLAFPVLERCEGGFRVRGLDRYDEAWRTMRSKSDRAQKAAAARWDGAARHAPAMLGACSSNARADAPAMLQHAQIQTQIQTQKKKEEACAPTAEPDELARLWNRTTQPPLPKVDLAKPLGKARRRALTEALKRRPLAEWQRVFERVNASSYCRGSKDWVADIDWATRAEGKKPEPATKVLEGSYDDHRARAGPDPNDGIIGATSAPAPLTWDRDTPAGKAFDEVLNQVIRDGGTYAAAQLERLNPRIEGETLLLATDDAYFGAWAEEHYGAVLRAAARCAVTITYPKPDTTGAAA